MEYTDDSTDTLYTIIKKFIYTATGYPAYTERKKFIKPYGNYATVYIMSYIDNMWGRGDESEPDSDGIITRSKSFNVQVTVRLYGDGAFNKMVSLKNYFASSTEYDDTPYFSSGDIALLSMNLITDVSVPIDEDNWEERAQSLMTFNTVFTWTETTGAIDNITITSTVSGGSSDVTGSSEIDSDGISTESDSDSDGSSDSSGE